VAGEGSKNHNHIKTVYQLICIKHDLKIKMDDRMIKIEQAVAPIPCGLNGRIILESEIEKLGKEKLAQF